jgi:hypothetical protein
MSKMFYTIEEVCQKLAKNESEINDMVSSGQIQEFRDGENLIFKVEQIDLLASPDDSGSIELDLGDAASGGSNTGLTMDLGDSSGFNLDGSSLAPMELSSTGDAMSLSSSSTGLPTPPMTPGSTGSMDSEAGVELSGSASGISAFEGAGDAGETQLGNELDEDLTLESVGSGSGLLDLTRESDDTSLGAELLEEVYSGEDEFDLPENSSGLFEAVNAPELGEAPVAGAGIAQAPAVMMEETVDMPNSGLSVGLCIGALVAMIIILIILASELEGGASMLTSTIAGGLWVWTGGLVGGALIAAGVGFFIGRASE